MKRLSAIPQQIMPRIETRRRRGDSAPTARPVQAIGLDVGDRFSYWCLLDNQGGVAAEGRVRTTPEGLRAAFASVCASLVALETGTHSGWISRLLSSFGHRVIVANARELRKIHASDRKNDRADAQILARLARVDPQLLAPITHRSAEMQMDLASIRARDVLVRARTKCINAARGLVKASGGRLPRCTTQSFRRQTVDRVPEELRVALGPLLESIQGLSDRIRDYDQQIEELAKSRYPQAQQLRQVAGVGALTATAFMLTLADASRFETSREVGAYLGLVPRQDDSGERKSQLPITKAGNTLLRRLIVGSAHYILGPFGPVCDLRRYGQRLTQRGGKNAKKRAVIAVARKLAVLLQRLWSTGEVYRPLRTTSPMVEAAA